MSNDPKRVRHPTGFASPPCYAAEIAPDYFDPLAVDPQQARDVARWRKVERDRLCAQRQALPVGDRITAGATLRDRIRGLLPTKFNGAQGKVLAAYWPIRGEPDLRPLMADLHDAGVTIALPRAEARSARLAFRVWTLQTSLIPDAWGIPAPPPDAAAVTPGILIIPLLGWSTDGHRLGYGDGCYDRTLAALAPRPVTIGVGFDAAQLATIFPQPHDVPLDFIVTETGQCTPS